MRPIFLYIIFLAYSCKVSAQSNNLFNLNIDNGLSSNHVYCTHIDDHGYLWIGTTDGLYRYNGYSLKKYDYNDGLPSNDVWGLQQDKVGRIWLKSIAQGIGYIKNSKYHAVYKADTILKQVYPKKLTCWNDTVIFSNGSYNSDHTYSFGIVINDTLYEKNLPASKYQYDLYFIFNDYSISVRDDTVKKYYRSGLFNLEKHTAGKFMSGFVPSIPIHSLIMTPMWVYNFADKYIVYASRVDSVINFYDIKSNSLHTKHLDGDLLSNYIILGDSIYSLTNNGVQIFDGQLSLIAKYNYNQITGRNNHNGMNTVFFQKNKLWGTLLSTVDEGLLIRTGNSKNFLRPESDLKGYEYINAKNDSTGYWWHEEQNKLVEVTNGAINKTRKLPEEVKNVRSIIKGVDDDVIISLRHILTLSKSTSQDGSLFNGYDTLIQFSFSNDDTLDLIINNDPYIKNYQSAFNNGLLLDSNNYLFLGTSIMGVVRMTFSTNIIYVKKINRERFENIIYDSASKQIVCYARDKILTVKDTAKEVLYQKYINKMLGIRGIENIFIDAYNHIIIKGYDKLILLNRSNNTRKALLNTYNLKNTVVHVNKDILTVAGSFGILKYRILSSGEIEQLYSYPNYKSLNYSRVLEAQISENNVLLHTDQGYFFVNTAYENTEDPTGSYRFIFNINDSLFTITDGDTLKLDQETSSIGIDVIKPTGTGTLNIVYATNGDNYTSTGKQLILSGLVPGKYNTVKLIATDDNWKSLPLSLAIYVKPLWWQTNTARISFLFTSIILLLTIIYFAIVITRRIVTRNNERRNQQRELELKSIYSQINPHFIFNSLSTAQYFIRKNKNKEAYEHINQFSDLLRAYIKSSRNKYIAIKDEIDNLKNYLELQLSRFENKFTYDFKIDGSINPSTVKVPSLLLQPIVENALNHGIFHKEGTGHIFIGFEKNKEEQLVCIVGDDGIGRKKAREIGSDRMKKASSYGTILIKELIDTFNKYEKINISLEYIDKQLPETGTTVRITIKDYHNAK